MQNVQNAAEIQQRVINLVELYRTKVGKEGQIAKEAKAEQDYWLKESIKVMHEEGLSGFGMSGEGPHTKVWIKHLMVNEQLLGHFYAIVAGENAENEVLDQLLPDVYDKTIFTEEQEAFLTAQFKEMVNYIILTPCNDSLDLVNRHDSKDMYLIPSEVLELIASRISIADGATIYNPFSGFAQFATLYNNCRFYCEESYEMLCRKANAFCESVGLQSKIRRVSQKMRAWMTLALYANKLNATIIKDGEIPTDYDAMLAFIPVIPTFVESEDFLAYDIEEITAASRISSSYKNLKDGGTMVLLIPSCQLYGNHDNRSYYLRAFLETVIKDGSVEEIIQLPDVMNTDEDFCILIIKKGKQDDEVRLIDARFASKRTDKHDKSEILCLEDLTTMLDNGGKDYTTGFRKSIVVPTNTLRIDALLPQTYVVETPLIDECPVPLSSLCTLAPSFLGYLHTDLPDNTPWVNVNSLTSLFAGALELSTMEKAGDTDTDFIGLFSLSGEYSLYKQGKRGAHIDDGLRLYTHLDGSHDAVLFVLTENEIKTALYRATGTPVAVNSSITVLIPKEGIDALSLVAQLRLPVVSRQIMAYHRCNVAIHLNNILVPANKRVIYDETRRMLREQDVMGDLEERLSNKETSLRMRKHALTQSLSSIKAMFVALNAFRKRNNGHLNDEDVISRIQGTKVQDAFEFLQKGLLEIMPALEHIADVEYSFGKVESFDPEEYMDTFIAKEKKGWLNFKPVVTWKKGSNKAQTNIFNGKDGTITIAKGQSLNTIRLPKGALEKIFDNIISNAKAYAFTDDTRKDYLLRFSWHTEGTSLIIEIENNGTPIPEDRDTKSLLEYGVSTALHHDGHNGIGCNEIDSIMRRYNGKVEIVSTPNDEFTVKYVLTFNDSYTYLPIKR